MPVEPMVATSVLLLVHTPPKTVLVSVAVEPTHTVDGPPMALGDALTVTVLMAAQEPPVENVIVAVPDDKPYTMPLVMPTDATEVLLLLHVPPDEVSLKVAVEPEQMLE